MILNSFFHVTSRQYKIPLNSRCQFFDSRNGHSSVTLVKLPIFGFLVIILATLYTCTYTRTRTNTHTYTHLHYTNVHTQTYALQNTHVHTHAYIRLHLHYTHVHTHTYALQNTHVQMHARMYTHTRHSRHKHRYIHKSYQNVNISLFYRIAFFFFSLIKEQMRNLPRATRLVNQVRLLMGLLLST